MAACLQPPSSLLSPDGGAAGGSLLFRWLIVMWPTPSWHLGASVSQGDWRGSFE